MYKTFLESLGKNLSEIKEMEDNEFEVIVSSNSVDRSGESINQDGIDIKEYMKNPVVLINHEYNVEAIIGKAVKVWKEGNITKARGVFSQSNPRAKLVKDLYNEGMLRTVSIGFIPLERRNGDEIIKSNMLEFSFVAIPCNPDALSTQQKELMKKGIENGLIKEVKEEKVEKPSLKDIMNSIQELQKNLSDDKEGKLEERINSLKEEINLLEKEKIQIKNEIISYKEMKGTFQNVDKALGDALAELKTKIPK